MYIGQYQNNDLGSLSSFFKKVVKTANKLNPLHSISAKIDPVTKLVDKAAGIKAPAKVVAPASPVVVAPTVPITATTPDIPITPNYSQPMSFGSGGGGGGISSAPVDAPAQVPVEIDYTPWLLGAAAVLGGILIFRMKRR